MTELIPILFAATEGAEAAAGHAPETGGIAALGLDPLAILAQAVTFLVLFFVIKKFALDKIVTSLEERRKTIDDGVRLGLEMQAEKEKLDEKVEAELQKTRLEADRILADAQAEAGGIIKKAETAAQANVETMLADARARIEDDVNKAKRELQKEVVGLVVDATETIIAERLDPKKDNALIERALAGAKK